jgi:hypothetical protein
LSKRGYLELPEGWERVSGDGPGWFVTTELLRRPDGTVVRWNSRAHRKGSAATAGGGQGMQASRERVWWRPHERSWWMAVLFAVGSLCFAGASVASQWGSSSRPAIGVTFFVGSLFFTSAAYLQFSEAVNVERRAGLHRRRPRWRPASWEPRRIDWLAAVVQLIGTVLFNISTFAALNHDLTTHQANARVWAPDAFGSIAFLAASGLAFAELCHRWVCVRRRSLSWRIVAFNVLGSIAFGVSAIASYTEPSSGEAVSARTTNAGTTLGAICFFVGALMLMPEAARANRATGPTTEQGQTPEHRLGAETA